VKGGRHTGRISAEIPFQPVTMPLSTKVSLRSHGKSRLQNKCCKSQQARRSTNMATKADGISCVSSGSYLNFVKARRCTCDALVDAN